MAVDRRDVVRWMAAGPLLWVAMPACVTEDTDKDGVSGDCCDTADPTADPGDSADTADSADSADSADTADTGEVADTADTADTATPEVCRTEADVEGPFYTPDAPFRDSLAEGSGTPIRIEGQVVSADDCAVPLAGAVFDAWHASDVGEYDNEGFSYRGRVQCDDQGRFVLETVLPGSYPDRPVRHVHFKVWDSAGIERITSQLYFSGDAAYDPARHRGPLLELDSDGVAQVVLGV